MKKYLIFIAVFIAFVFMVFVLFFFDANDKTQENNDEPEFGDVVDEDASQARAEEYIKNNISELSPEKEVLGGKFFVTKFEFLGSNEAEIEYEDGHNSFGANVIFDVEGDEIIIYDFSVISINGQTVGDENNDTNDSEDEFSSSTDDKIEAVDCLPEQRNVDACIEIYQPVCGQVMVECIKAPCDPVKETFANPCKACMNPRVLSYVDGECMEDDEIK